MAINDTNLSTASTDEIQLPEIVVTPGDLSGPGRDPNQVLGTGNADSITAIKLPLDTPPYYTKIGVHKYARTNWRSVATFQFDGMLLLPIPGTMEDTHQVKYTEKALGMTGAAAAGFIGSTLNTGLANTLAGLGENASIEDIRNALLRAGVSAASVNGGILPRAIVDGSLAAAGMAINNFLTVMLEGPQYKTRQFHWRFSPKSAQESEELRKAIVFLNESMAPDLFGSSGNVLGSAFFTWPKVFRVEFSYLGGRDLSRQLFKMKPMVLTGAQFNYAPQGIPAFHAGTSAPAFVDISLAFLELEYWLKGDFDGTRANQSPTLPTEPLSNNNPPGNTPGAEPPFIPGAL